MAPQKENIPENKRDNIYKIIQGVSIALVLAYLQWNASTLRRVEVAMERYEEKFEFNKEQHKGYDQWLQTMQNKTDNMDGRLIRVEAILPYEERKKKQHGDE